MEQGQGTASWVTDRVCSATLRVPVREEPVLADTEKETVPFPIPLAPEVITIQGSSLVAVQGQSLAVLTDTLPYPPEAGKEAGLVG